MDTNPVRLAVILGTNEIASAIEERLLSQGFRVVLSHDPLPPVIRRKMAFHDALFDDDVTVEVIAARRAKLDGRSTGGNGGRRLYYPMAPAASHSTP